MGSARNQRRLAAKNATWTQRHEGRFSIIEIRVPADPTAPPNRIVQAWRTTEFPAGSPDSRLELLFDVAKSGTRLTLIQTDLPPGQADQYKVGWRDYYFAPMREYFAAAAPK